MPKVSICIPAYNQAEHLKKTIDSVLIQTYTDYEIVLTDDSPGTIVSELVAAYNLPDKIKYYKNSFTLGSPENWNESIRRSSGQYIKILHHDDWFNFNDSLAKYVKLLDDNPGADFAFSATHAIFPGADDWVHEVSTEQLKELKTNPLLLYLNNIIGAPSTTIFRKNSELQFDRKLKWQVDKEFYIRQLRNNHNLAYSPELLLITFVADGRVTDECLGNKDVEVFEYLYVLDKICTIKNFYSPAALRKCLLQAITICSNYDIKSIGDIRNCGYHGAVQRGVKTWLALNAVSPVLGKLYLKFLRRY